MTRNYSSDVRRVDPTRKVDRDVHIWMNNPLRFAGETFYQSSFYKDKETGVETTGLQVVSNTGWMIPYVSCMIVGVGMLFQFSVTLLRFLNRRDSAEGTGRRSETVATIPAKGIGPAARREARQGGRGRSDAPAKTLHEPMVLTAPVP